MHILEPIEEQKELSQEQKEKLAKTLADNFQKWDEDRNSQITVAKDIMQEVYLNQPKLAVEKDMEWKSDVKLNALYNIKRTKKAVLWREMWSNPAQMFDVRGTSEQTEELAKAQKAAIVDSLTKMNVGKAFDNGIDNLFDVGEIIFKTDWEKRSKVVKRQVKNQGFVMQNLVRLMGKVGFQVQTEQMQDVILPYYENARVESVSPFMFVFDHSKWDFKRESWEKLIKISKRFESLDDLKQNKLYDITPEMIAELNDDKENKTAENKELMELREENYYGGKYSVLYAHGDFKINGKIYKNYIAEVLAGKYLIRFEENPLFICPFILCALEYDPLTKRGISPLKSILGLCKEEEKLANTAFDVQKLTANPCMYANEELFDESNTESDGNILIAPGKVIKYKSDFSGTKPEPINVSAGGISDLLAFLNNRISEVSSVSDVMFGNIESAKRTATELSLADKGSSSQASKELDTINQDLTLPMIENVAELLAMFKDGTEVLFYEDKGKKLEAKITNAIRQAQYNYYYEDRNAVLERKAKFNELYQLFTQIGQDPEMRRMIDWKETIITAVEMIGFDNSDKFFLDDTPINQLTQVIETMPEQLQQQVVGQFMGYLQQLQMQMQQPQVQQPQMQGVA
jgi:hypothetical protein